MTARVEDSKTPLNLDGYPMRGEWTSGKAKPVRSRLVADFTGWERMRRSRT